MTCTRHFASPDPNTKRSYYAKRCMHVGNRFVVEIRPTQWDGGFVDYVEDLPDGEVIVEGHSALNYGAGEDPETDEWGDRADDLWDYLTKRMMAGDPPNPDWGD